MTQTAIPATQARLKTPATRLLDLLIGWAEWVGEEEDSPREPGEAPVVDPCLTSETLYDLYQAAGGVVAGLPKDDPEAERQAVITFLVDKVLPVLLRTEASDHRQEAA